jgi:hypothetical protein
MNLKGADVTVPLSGYGDAETGAWGGTLFVVNISLTPQWR